MGRCQVSGFLNRPHHTLIINPKTITIYLIQHYTSYQSLANYLLTTDYSLKSTALLSQYSTLKALYIIILLTFVSLVINLFSI